MLLHDPNNPQYLHKLWCTLNVITTLKAFSVVAYYNNISILKTLFI